MSLTEDTKSIQEMNIGLKQLHECKKGIFDSFVVFDSVFRAGERAVEDLQRAAVAVTPADEYLDQVLRHLNWTLFESQHKPVLRIAHFLALYGFCEGSMSQICRCFSSHVSSESKRRGWGMALSSTYLEESVGVNLPDFFVREGKLLIEVRNALIHQNGIVTDAVATKIKKCQDDVLANSPRNGAMGIRNKLVKSCSVFEGESGETRLLLGEGFTESALALVRIMFSKLLESCEQELRTLIDKGDSTVEE